MLNPPKTGLVLGGLMGLGHLFWAALVAFGGAQMVIDFMFRVHFITPIFVVGLFDAGTAGTLIVVTALCGYVMGWVFAMLWNRLHR